MTDDTAQLFRDLIAAGVDAALIARVATAIKPKARASYSDLPTFVYFLTDPRDGVIFYVGITISPYNRFEQHRNDPTSAAWKRIREIEDAGLECEFEVVEECPNRQSAMDREFHFIGVFGSDLVNKDRQRRKVFRGQLV